MRLHLLASWLFVSCIATLPAIAQTNWQPDQYRATYAAKYNGMPVEATRELKKTNQGYRLVSSVKGLLGHVTEQEEFHLGSEGRIHPDRYTSEKAFLGIESSEQMVVDNKANKAVYTRKKKVRELAVSAHYLGPVSYQVQLARDLQVSAPSLSYQIMSRGKIRDYHFEILGEENLTIPIGVIRVLKLQRVRDAGEQRQTVFWMAPDWGFLIVKIYQQEEDGANYELILKTAKINGKPVSPTSEPRSL